MHRNICKLRANVVAGPKMRFHRRCGDRVTLLHDNTTAIRNFVEFNHGLILSAEPIADDVIFEVCIDRKVSLRPIEHVSILCYWAQVSSQILYGTFLWPGAGLHVSHTSCRVSTHVGPS